jgi:cation transport regulator ChaB
MPTGQWTPPDAGDAPQGVKDILKSVYSDCRDKNPGEVPTLKEKCAKMAWGAVRNAGWHKDESGTWVKESDRRSENVTTGEFEQLEEATSNALPKKFVSEDGTALIKIIAPGWGSSGYYAEAMLERDAPKVYVPTTHMHIDHPTPSQEKGLPERSLTTLAGVITGAGKYLKNGLQGPGVYAEAKIFKQYRDFLNEMAPYIGVSHRAIGKAVPGTAEGKNGKIIETLQKVMSVDFVTLPGAGGGLVQMYESYREAGDAIQEATGCALALSDVYPGKQWTDLSSTEMGHFRSLHAWVGGDGLEDCHLPIKGPDGAVKSECVRNALARLNQVQGLSGSAEASVRSKLEGILNKINKEALDMEMTSLKLETLKEARPDLIKAILDESERSTESTKNRDKMTAELEKYKKDNGEMQKEVSRLQEAKALGDATAYAGKELAKTQLPEVTKARLQETLPKGITLKEGNLDEVAFAETVKVAIKAESEYVAKITEAGKVRGFGGAGAGDGTKILKETFKQTYLAEGMSEVEAEKRATIAAQGR